MATDPVEAVRLALRTLPSVQGRSLRVAIALQGSEPQARIGGGGGTSIMAAGFYRPEIVLDVFGAGGSETAGAPLDDGTAAAIAHEIVEDVENLTDPIDTTAGDVVALAVTQLPGVSDDPLTDRPQWVMGLTAIVFPA